MNSFKELSLEYRLLLGYHVCMMLMFAAGGVLTITAELVIVGIILGVMVVLSIQHRRRTGWRWPGLRPRNIVGILSTLCFGGLFFFVVSRSAPPLNPRALPWYLAGLGIIGFGILQGLQLVTPTEAEFLKASTPEAPSQPDGEQQARRELLWQRGLRGFCSLCFLATWLTILGSMYYSGELDKQGKPTPTITHTQPHRNHGTVVYITPAEEAWLTTLQAGGHLGVFGSIALMLTTHFIVGVKLIPNAPTLRELRDRNQI